GQAAGEVVPLVDGANRSERIAIAEHRVGSGQIGGTLTFSACGESEGPAPLTQEGGAAADSRRVVGIEPVLPEEESGECVRQTGGGPGDSDVVGAVEISGEGAFRGAMQPDIRLCDRVRGTEGPAAMHTDVRLLVWPQSPPETDGGALRPVVAEKIRRGTEAEPRLRKAAHQLVTDDRPRLASDLFYLHRLPEAFEPPLRVDRLLERECPTFLRPGHRARARARTPPLRNPLVHTVLADAHARPDHRAQGEIQARDLAPDLQPLRVAEPVAASPETVFAGNVDVSE